MTVVIITTNKYPDGDAGAYRQHMFAKMLVHNGCNVLVLGFGSYMGNRIESYDGIQYTSMRSKCQNKFGKLANILFLPAVIRRCLQLCPTNIDAILVGDVLFPRCFRFLRRYAKRKNISIVHDSVEWYSPEEFKNGKRALAYKLKDRLNTKCINKEWNVIAISKYLHEHFSEMANKTVRIPVVMDIESIRANLISESDEKCTVVYAGGPGHKDYLKEIISGFLLLDEKYRRNIEFHIVGVNDYQLIHTCGIDKTALDQAKGFIWTHGRVPHSEAIDWVRKADFTILVRDEQLRYAKAGFPTKIVESLACGTPPICNYSSDLIDYLSDKENALIINGHHPSDIASTLEYAVQMSKNDKDKMRVMARQTAEKYFDYHNYLDELNAVLFCRKEIVKNNGRTL